MEQEEKKNFQGQVLARHRIFSFPYFFFRHFFHFDTTCGLVSHTADKQVAVVVVAWVVAQL